MQDRFVDLLRHGAVQGVAGFRGGHDDPLSTEDREQMTRATAGNPRWTGIVQSPFRRCSKLAHCLAESFNLPVSIMPGLPSLMRHGSP
jgi:alpha-ribazole phosphatase